MRIAVVIPTLNERDAIALVLQDLPRDLVSDIVVVDAGSTDGTPDIARGLGARVIDEPRRGYGRACLTGLAEVGRPDIVVFLDGDYSDRPSELPRLVAPILDGTADIVIGSRLAGDLAPGALPWHSRAGNRLAAWLIRRLSGVAMTDPGPFRAARFDVLQALRLSEAGYGWPVEIIMRGAEQGWRVAEVPVSYFPRLGQSKITGTIRGSIGAAWGILTAIARHRPRRAPARSV